MERLIDISSLNEIDTDGIGDVIESGSNARNQNNVGSLYLSKANEIAFGSAKNKNCPHIIYAGELGWFDLDANKLEKPISVLNKFTLSDLLRLVDYLQADDLLVQDGEPPIIKVLNHCYRISDKKLATMEITTAINELTGTTVITSSVRNAVKDTPFKVSVQSIEGIISFRGNGTKTLGSNGADEGATYIFRRRGNHVHNYDELGIPEKFRKQLIFDKGLVIVTGEQGSGKSTLLEAPIREWVETRRDNLVTYEDPIEKDFRTIAGYKAVIGQSDLSKNFGGDWRVAERECMRRSARAVFIGETRDIHSATTVLSLAQANLMVWTTGHSSTPHEYLSRFIGWFDDAGKPRALAGFIEIVRTFVCTALVIDKNGSRIQLRSLFGVNRDFKVKTYGLSLVETIEALRQEFVSYGHTFLDDLLSYKERFSKEQLEKLHERFSADFTKEELNKRGLNIEKFI